MTARILRWKGGSAGDMIMYIMHLSGYTIENIKFLNNIGPAGQVQVDFSHIHNDINEVQKIALNQNFRKQLDHDQLVREISGLDNVWIKSHYYCNTFDDITTDIIVDAKSLPFVMSANIYKTDTLLHHTFHPIAYRIKDPKVKIKIALHSVGVDCVNTKTSSCWSLLASDIITGWDSLAKGLNKIDVDIDPQGQKFYQEWYQNNQHYFPSTRYLDMIQDLNYDYNCDGLSLVERYALLVLSQEKFRILKD